MSRVMATHCGGCNGFGPGWVGDCAGVDPDEVIPAAGIRNTTVGFIGTLAHARKYTWATDGSVAELLDRLDALVTELAAQLPENAITESKS